MKKARVCWGSVLMYILLIIVWSLIFGGSARGDTYTEFYVDKTYYDVVDIVEHYMRQPYEKAIILPILPAVVHEHDLAIDAHLRPSQRHYTVDIKLMQPKGKLYRLDKKVEIWGHPNRYRVRSTIGVGWGQHCRLPCINKLKARIIRRVESRLLAQERQMILRWANVEVDTNYESKFTFSWIGRRTWELIVILIDKLNNE